jgi:hypothetical protein
LVAGASGISWEIDAKAVRHGGDAFLVVECRRHPDARLKKKDIAALAYVIADTGAAGGIVVTPLELQAGAKRVAEHANIIHVKLSANSTTADYLLKFLNQVFAGVTESIDVSDDFSAVITRATGSTERKSGA